MGEWQLHKQLVCCLAAGSFSLWQLKYVQFVSVSFVYSYNTQTRRVPREKFHFQISQGESIFHFHNQGESIPWHHDWESQRSFKERTGHSSISSRGTFGNLSILGQGGSLSWRDVGLKKVEASPPTALPALHSSLSAAQLPLSNPPSPPPPPPPPPPDFLNVAHALCHILQSIFILTNVCFHFTPHQPPPPPPPAAEVQLRFHCQGQLCCRQLPAIGPTCGRSCRKLSPSDHFPRLAFLFASPPDFAKDCSKKIPIWRFVENVSTNSPQQ